MVVEPINYINGFLHLVAKVYNIIHKDMVFVYITKSNMFDNGRTKYSTHLNTFFIGCKL